MVDFLKMTRSHCYCKCELLSVGGIPLHFFEQFLFVASKVPAINIVFPIEHSHNY